MAKKPFSKPKPRNQPVNKPLGKIRLNKFLAQTEISSRRKADRAIEEGRVQVNGRKVYEMGVQVDPQVDRIQLDGKILTAESSSITYAFYKPKQVISTMSDPEGRPSLESFFKSHRPRLFPIGRLDWRAEGLLLMTSDGRLAQRVLHSEKKIGRTYLVKIEGQINADQMRRLKTGVSVLGGRGRVDDIEKIDRGDSKSHQWFRVRVSEGHNKFLRKMFEKLGMDVLKLQSVAIGFLTIRDLKPGETRELTRSEISKIFMQPVDEPRSPIRSSLFSRSN